MRFQQPSLRGAKRRSNLDIPSLTKRSPRVAVYLATLAMTAVVFLILTGCATPQIAVNSHADFSRVHRVAVATFGGPGGDVAADLLIQDLLQRGADIVERRQLDSVLREHRLATDRIMDPTTAKKIGKVLGVDAIFVGTVGENTPSQSYLVTTGRHGAHYDSVTPVNNPNLYVDGSVAGIPHSQILTSAAHASLIVRMVDVETGSILWSGRMSYEGLDSQQALASITSSLTKSLTPLWPMLHP